MKNLKKISLVALLFATTMSCKKIEADQDSASSGTVPFYVRLMDAPAYYYEEVNVEIERVEVRVNHSTWIPLNSRPGVVNLLKLTNGIDIPLGQRALPAGTLIEMRLTIGDYNTLKVDGQMHRLELPDGFNHRLLLPVNQPLRPGSGVRMMVDFDAAQSVVKMPDGTYQLKPVVRAVNLANTGTIQGKVTTTRRVAIIAYSHRGAFSTYSDEGTGGYQLRGLPSAEYDVTFFPGDGSMPVTVTDVMVKTGVTTPMKEQFFGAHPQ